MRINEIDSELDDLAVEIERVRETATPEEIEAIQKQSRALKAERNTILHPPPVKVPPPPPPAVDDEYESLIEKLVDETILYSELVKLVKKIVLMENQHIKKKVNEKLVVL